jgi:nucleoporin POM152
MSPISTAELNNHGLSFCLAAPENFVLIPVLLNNTNLHGLKYSLTPLGHDGMGPGKVEYIDLTAKDFKAIEQSRLDGLKSSRPSSSTTRDSEEYDEYDEEDNESQTSHSSLQTTQSLIHIRLTKPGTLRLERVFDSSNIDARLAYPASVTVVPCPRVEFFDDELPKEDVRCSGEDSELQLMIDTYGISPLSLRWLKTVNGIREHFLVEGIESRPEHDDVQGDKISSRSSPEIDDRVGNTDRTVTAVPQDIKIPLTISLDVPGTYVYALEEVVDGVGNVIRVGADGLLANPSSNSQTKTTRSLVVLRRPTISFKNCKLGAPTSLLIGSEATLPISMNNADDFDSPWEIQLKYQPPIDADNGTKGNKRFKPWRKTLTTQGNRKELNIRATAPGDYTIVGVRGKVPCILLLSGYQQLIS